VTHPAEAREHNEARERDRLRRIGHREFVGGMWEEIGRRQFDFLHDHGLEPAHVLLDIGCGALRGGRHFIAYLDAGNYLGIDKHAELLRLGADEVGREHMVAKRPELVASADFDFHRFTRRPDVALAQSLFTHLTADDIARCLVRLREHAGEGCVFWASFFIGDSSANPALSASDAIFKYSPEELALLGEAAGWISRYVGPWDHPRRQVLMRFTG
jgi:hypothetical protein